MGSFEEGNKKTDDPKIAEDFMTNPDHISFSLLLLLLLLYAVFLLLFVVTIVVVFQYISGHYSSIRSEDHNICTP